jgi:glycosyltransferase involved in cell wall biosynthesis
MNKKKIYIIGQFPPPVHGLSIALQTLVESSRIKKSYCLDYIDIKNNKKFVKHIYKIFYQNSDLYYFTISQSLLGNLRDMIILSVLLCKRKRVIIHYHGGFFRNLYIKMNYLQKNLNKLFLSKVDSMIVLSEGLKKLFIDIIPKNKIDVCENYISDSNLIEESEFSLKNSMVKNKKKIDVLYLSNFIKSKGYMDVMECSKILQKEPITFHFAGSFFTDNDKEEFLKFIKENKLHDNVIYHGPVYGENKKNLLRNSNILVLPTYYPNEGQPISIIEAMGNGLTIITTDHAGIPDIVSERNGYIINPKSPKEISRSLLHLINDRERLVEFANTNRETVLGKYREEHYIERLINIFDEVLHK